MTQKAAALYDAGDDMGAGEAANMAKYAAAEAACDAADRAVQTHGGNGITQEYGMAGLLVATRAGRIAPVSREMILNFVAMHSPGAAQVVLRRLTVPSSGDAGRPDPDEGEAPRRTAPSSTELLDEVLVATLATVTDRRPAVGGADALRPRRRPGAAARLDRRRGAAAGGAGAEAVLAVHVVDGLVLATSLFEHSANYRSAVVRGPLVRLGRRRGGRGARPALRRLVPGRRAEVRGHLRKEVAATVALALDITDDNWLLKVSDQRHRRGALRGGRVDRHAARPHGRTASRCARPGCADDVPVPPSVEALRAGAQRRGTNR